MLHNRIDITISPEKILTVNAAFATIETELDILISLDPKDAKRLAFLGLRNETFTRGIMEAAAQNPTVVPQSVDLAGLNRDLSVREQLLSLEQRAQKLYERLNHTNLVLGADLYSGALAIYKSLKVFGRAAGLGLLIEELGRRFARNKTKKKTTPPAPTA